MSDIELLQDEFGFLCDSVTRRFMDLIRDRFMPLGRLVILRSWFKTVPGYDKPRLSEFVFLTPDNGDLFVFSFTCIYVADGAGGLSCRFERAYSNTSVAELIVTPQLCEPLEPEPDRVKRLADVFDKLLDQARDDVGASAVSGYGYG
jgi:hypothetical protein